MVSYGVGYFINIFILYKFYIVGNEIFKENVIMLDDDDIDEEISFSDGIG